MIDLYRMALYFGVDAFEDEERMELLSSYALEYIERETHRPFRSPAEVTEILPGTGNNRLWLTQPVIGPSEEYPMTIERYRNTSTPTEISEFTVRGRSVLTVNGGHWDRASDYHVTYYGGFTQLPLDIEREVFDLVRWRLGNLDDASAGMKSESIGDYSYTRGAVEEGGFPWLPRLNATINRWKDEPV